METAVHHPETSHEPRRSQARLWIALLVFLAVAAFFLWEEHKAHILGALPYLIFLLCPLMHIFHRGHGNSRGGKEKHHGT